MNNSDGLVDFYPTPLPLIGKLAGGLNFSELSTFLEPSAGKGDIADYILRCVQQSDYYRRREADLDVIEINPDLQHVLRGKIAARSAEGEPSFRLVHDDFLTFQTRKHYDLIIANFPFSEGDKHLARALDIIAANGGNLRCLVNAETIHNPHTNLRKSIAHRLEEMGAKIEFIANAFEKAERPTNVEVALIKVEAERPEAPSVILDALQKAQTVEAAEYAPRDLAPTGFLDSIVALFNQECAAGIRLIEEYYALRPHIADRLVRPGEDNYSKPLLTLFVGEHSASSCIGQDINKYLAGVRHKYWEGLLRDPRFTSNYTSNLLRELEAKLRELRDYDFTVFNIKSLQEEMAGKVIAGVEAAILDLFDTCSRKHAYGDDFGNNIWYYNGWKTNKAHCINRKIILPMYGLRSEWSGGLQIEYRFADTLTDMVKVFNYLSRDKVDVPRLVGNCIHNANQSRNFNLDLRYFDIKLYKKGTAHITFKDPELLKKFNICGSQRKGWLPPCYGKKKYSEMSQEEKRVIDEFQGKAEYEKVMADPGFYLVDARTLLLEA